MSSFWIDWSDGKKWLMGILASLALAVLVALLTKYINSYSVAITEVGSGKPTAPSPTGEKMPFEGAPARGLLPDEVVSQLISKELNRGNLNAAQNLLQSFAATASVNLECQHIFDYALRKTDFKVANEVASSCWTEEELKSKLRTIEHERVKHQPKIAQELK